MKELIDDIKEAGKVRGFTHDRLQQLMKTEFRDCQGYEWRLLLVWSEMYLCDFEKLYNLQIPQDETVDFDAWIQERGLPAAGIKRNQKEDL